MNSNYPSDEKESQDDPILVHLDHGVLSVTLNRPELGNSLSPSLRDHLAAIFQEASGDLRVRSILLGANGKAFCTGADLRSKQQIPLSVLPQGEPSGFDLPDRPAGSIARMLRDGWQNLILSVFNCEKPVVCALSGTAAGGGANLALACDLIVMSDQARLIEIFIKRAIVPDAGGCYLLPRLVGLSRAKEIMYFGDDISSSRALEFGLVNKVVDHDKTTQHAFDWALRLAQGPTRTLSLTKHLLNRSLDGDIYRALEDEASAQEAAMLTTSDANEGVAAFVERRDPTYKGF